MGRETGQGGRKGVGSAKHAGACRGVSPYGMREQGAGGGRGICTIVHGGTLLAHFWTVMPVRG